MSLEIDNYCTTSFILKDDESVKYIKNFCNLLMNPDNLYSGSLCYSAFCRMSNYKEHKNSFVINAGGFIDTGPELKGSVVGDTLNPYLCLWDEIQKHLENDTWFFVNCHTTDTNNNFSIGVMFYHQDGRREVVSDYTIKKKILNNMNI